MYGFYNNYGGWGAGSMMGWIGGGIMMIVFWVFLISIIIWIVRETRGTHVHHGSEAVNILKERYAKGEISKEEFNEKKKDLSA